MKKKSQTPQMRAGVSRVLRNILDEQARMRRWQVRHGREDKTHFSSLARTLEAQPTKADIDEIKNLLVDPKGEVKFSTKEDVAEVVNAWKNIKLGAVIVSGGGKWGFRVVLALAALFGAWAVFKGGLVAVLMWLVSWTQFK